MLRPFEKSMFPFFCKFLSDKTETVFWENEAKRSKVFKSKFGHRKLLRKYFQGTLSSKTNVLSISKGHFLVFCRFLSDEVETIFCESEAKRLKVFKSRFGHMMLLRNWLWSYLELPKLPWAEVETTSWESEAKCQKLFKLTLFRMEGWTLYQCFPCNFYKRRN